MKSCPGRKDLKELVNALSKRETTQGQGQSSPPPSPIFLKLTGAGMWVSIAVPTHVLDTCVMRSCQNARDENPEMSTFISETLTHLCMVLQSLKMLCHPILSFGQPHTPAMR